METESGLQLHWLLAYDYNSPSGVDGLIYKGEQEEEEEISIAPISFPHDMPIKVENYMLA